MIRPLDVVIGLDVPDTHIADTQRPLPYCLTAAEMKKSPQLSELL